MIVVTMKPWDGPHPPTKREKVMSKVSEFFQRAGASEAVFRSRASAGYDPFQVIVQMIDELYGDAETPAEEPRAIIRAAEGVTLEPGEYDTCSGRIGTSEKVAAIQFVDDEWVFEFSSPSGAVCQYTSVRRVDPKPASEPVAPAAGGERAIVVGSTWRENCTGAAALRTVHRVTDMTVTTLKDGLYEGVWTKAEFRDCHSHVSDPAPPQQPAERVEPVAGSEHAALQLGYGALRDRLVTIVDEAVGLQPVDISDEDLLTLLEKDHHDWRMRASLARQERDAAIERCHALEHERDGQANAARYWHENSKTLSAIVKRAKACHQWEKLDDARLYLVDATSLSGATRSSEAARAGLDPKACGELIARVRHELVEWAAYWGNHEPATDEAVQAVDKLAAMLGVEVAGG